MPAPKDRTVFDIRFNAKRIALDQLDVAEMERSEAYEVGYYTPKANRFKARYPIPRCNNAPEFPPHIDV